MEHCTEINLAEEIKVDNSTNETSLLKLRESPFCLPLKMTGFTSEKEQASFLKSTERIIRNSTEYRSWVSYVTSTLGYNVCSLTHEKLVECTLDVHHHPIALFSLVKIVTDEFIEKNREFSSFDIALRTMELHYQNKVGYTVLLSDIHSKFHNGYQKIPIEHVHGDYKYILDNFNIDDDERNLIMERSNTHIEDCKIEWSKDSYPGLKN